MNGEKNLREDKEIAKTLAAAPQGGSAGKNGDGEAQPRRERETEAPAADTGTGKERNGGKKSLTVILAAVACAALVLGGVVLGRQTKPDPDTPGEETRQPQAGDRETSPETEISGEERLYQQTLAYCEELASTGDMEEVLYYLAGCVPADGSNPRLEELQDYYEYQFAQETLAQADTLCEDGFYLAAISLIRDARNVCDSEMLRQGEGDCRQAFGVYNTSRLAAGKYNTVLLRDGYVDICGDSTYGELKADDWRDIVAVSAGDRHILGLRADGSVVAAGSNDERQTDVGNWWNVIAISAGDTHSVALCADGTVLATGYNHMGQCDVVNLMRSAGEKRIVSVAAGYGHTLALLEDGTVLATGVNEHGECSVYGWSDIAAIYAGTEISAGLRTDGTVVATGRGTQNWDLSGWTDIVNLAAGDFYLVGLKADGTVLAVMADDRNYDSQGQLNVGAWYDAVMIAAGNDHTVAIRADGTLLCVGSDRYGQCRWDGKNIS